MPRLALTTLHATRTNEVIALLGSMGIDAEVQSIAGGQAELLVDDRDVARVERLLAEEYDEERLQTPVPT